MPWEVFKRTDGPMGTAPMVSLTPKSSSMRFNRAAVRSMGLDPGTKVDLLVDREAGAVAILPSTNGRYRLVKADGGAVYVSAAALKKTLPATALGRFPLESWTYKGSTCFGYQWGDDDA